MSIISKESLSCVGVTRRGHCPILSGKAGHYHIRALKTAHSDRSFERKVKIYIQ